MILDPQRNDVRSLRPHRFITQLVGFLFVFLLFACGGLGNQKNLFRISISPETVTIAAGDSHTFQVSGGVGNIEASFSFETTAPLTCSPTGPILRTGPFTEDVVVTVPEGTTPGSTYRLNVMVSGNSEPQVFAVITVGAPEEEGDFTFTANSSVALCPPGSPSAPITFTVSSLRGYTGPVYISWDNEVSGAAPSNPTPNPFTVTVAPGSPATFTRTFSRNATHNVDIPIRFTGTLAEVYKDVTIVVRHDEVE